MCSTIHWMTFFFYYSDSLGILRTDTWGLIVGSSCIPSLSTIRTLKAGRLMINLLLICKMSKRKHFNIQCVCMINTNFKFVHVTTVTYTRRIEHGSVDLGWWSNWYILFITFDNSILWTSWKHLWASIVCSISFSLQESTGIFNPCIYFLLQVGLPYMYRTCINYRKLLILIKTFKLTSSTHMVNNSTARALVTSAKYQMFNSITLLYMV